MESMKRTQLDHFLEEYCKSHQFSGSIRITYKGEKVYQSFLGKADFEKDIPLDEDSVFTLYSLSKPFCAIGFLKLYDKGLVDIDAHPSIYLPEMKAFDTRVTLRQMLHHTSGLPDFEQTKEFAEKYINGPYHKLREHLQLLAEYPMFFEPGTAARYANINFLPLALIIENVTGLSYADYMKKEVFEPLGMKTARIDEPGMHVPNRVNGYELRDKGLMHIDRSLDWMLGAGDILGTLDDVYCLNKAIKEQKLLKPETWKEVLTPSPLNSMGMGCSISDWHGKKRITHNGGYLGFRTLHIQLPEDDFDMILLSNTGFGDARYEISEAIHSIYYGHSNQSAVRLEMDKGYI